MTLWLLVPAFAIVSIIQTAVLPMVSIAGLRPDLALLIVVAWGLLSNPGEAAVWGFVGGLFLDLASGLPFGTQTLALTGVGLLLSLAQTNIFRSNLLLPPAAMLLATLVYNLIILGILSTLGWQINWEDYVVWITLPTALINTFVLPLVYFPLQRLHRFLHPQVEW
ncbi:MAG: rod shape-determining protein MreD [Chloroflexi bacterium]|nr:rod shape-determining protein MreD [Chloroflexota bacterium]MCL5950453.1 rod shape-determining protein MreD [Chloroflexota bacterium]